MGYLALFSVGVAALGRRDTDGRVARSYAEAAKRTLVAPIDLRVHHGSSASVDGGVRLVVATRRSTSTSSDVDQPRSEPESVDLAVIL